MKGFLIRETKQKGVNFNLRIINLGTNAKLIIKSPRTYTIKLFIAVVAYHSSGPIKGSTMVGSSLATKCKRRMEVNGSGKHFSLLRYNNKYFI
jgi:hypothetical protein